MGCGEVGCGGVGCGGVGGGSLEQPRRWAGLSPRGCRAGVITSHAGRAEPPRASTLRRRRIYAGADAGHRAHGARPCRPAARAHREHDRLERGERREGRVARRRRRLRAAHGPCVGGLDVAVVPIAAGRAEPATVGPLERGGRAAALRAPELLVIAAPPRLGGRPQLLGEAVVGRRRRQRRRRRRRRRRRGRRDGRVRAVEEREELGGGKGQRRHVRTRPEAAGGDGGGREGLAGGARVGRGVPVLARDVDEGAARVDGEARKGGVERAAAVHARLVEAVGGVRHAHAARER